MFQSLNRDKGRSDFLEAQGALVHPVFQSLNRDKGRSDIGRPHWQQVSALFQSLNRDKGRSDNKHLTRRVMQINVSIPQSG